MQFTVFMSLVKLCFALGLLKTERLETAGMKLSEGLIKTPNVMQHGAFVFIMPIIVIRKRKANWIGHILRRNCLLKQVIEGKIKGEIEVTRRRGRRRKKLVDDLKDRRGYHHLKEEALDRTMWRNRFGRGVGPVVR